MGENISKSYIYISDKDLAFYSLLCCFFTVFQESSVQHEIIILYLGGDLSFCELRYIIIYTC